MPSWCLSTHETGKDQPEGAHLNGGVEVRVHQPAVQAVDEPLHPRGRGAGVHRERDPPRVVGVAEELGQLVADHHLVACDEVPQLPVAARLRDDLQHQTGDPFADDFRMWVEHAPELPADVNALFTARRKAIAKYENEEAAELAREIRKRGVSVRDEKKRQYYRCER